MQAIYIILFVSAVLIGTMSLTEKDGAEPGDATLNFLTYRDAVMEYAENNTLVNGTIPTTSLNTLPNTWIPTSTWSNQVVGNIVYIWGQLSAEGKRELEKMTYCSQAYFYSQGFTLQAICTGATTGVAFPVSLPNKTVVSVIEVH